MITHHEHRSGCADIPVHCVGPVCNPPWANIAHDVANDVASITYSTSPLVYHEPLKLVFLRTDGRGGAIMLSIMSTRWPFEQYVSLRDHCRNVLLSVASVRTGDALFSQMFFL